MRFLVTDVYFIRRILRYTSRSNSGFPGNISEYKKTFFLDLKLKTQINFCMQYVFKLQTNNKKAFFILIIPADFCIRI